MSLSAQEQKELAELEEMDRLESQVGHLAPAAAASSAQPKNSAAMSALEGFGQTASQGYLPELQAGASTLTRGISKLIPGTADNTDEQLRSQGFQLPEESYRKDLEQNYARQAQQGKEHPIAAGAGKLGGIITSGIALSPVMPGEAIKSGGLASRMGQGALAGAKQGAVQGAAYNPGLTQEGENPLQLGKRVNNAGVGMAVGAPLGAAGGALSRASQVQDNINLVKDPQKAAAFATDQLKNAKQQLWEKSGQPNDQALTELLKGKQIPLSALERQGLTGVSGEADDILNQATSGAQNQYGQVPDSINLDAQQARTLRSLLGKEAKFKPQTVYDTGATAAKEEAAKAQGLVSQKLKQIDGVAPLDDAMSQSARYNQTIDRGMLRRPLETLSPAQGSTKEAILAGIDSKAGTNLRETGQDLKQAKNLLFKGLGDLGNPLKLTGKAAARSSVKLGDILNSVGAPKSLQSRGVDELLGSDELVRALMEGKR